MQEDMKQDGLSWSTMRRAAEQDVEVEHYRQRGKDGAQQTWWRLPDGHPALILDDEDEPPKGTIEELLAESGDLDDEFKKLLGGDSNSS